MYLGWLAKVQEKVEEGTQKVTDQGTSICPSNILKQALLLYFLFLFDILSPWMGIHINLTAILIFMCQVNLRITDVCVTKEFLNYT